MSEKTWTPMHRAEYIRALKRTFTEIARKVEELDSRLTLRDEKAKKEAIRIIKETAGDQKKLDDWKEKKAEAFCEEGMTISIEYGKAIEQLKELGLKLAPHSAVKRVGLEGFFFQIRIGCMQAIAFLDDLLGGGNRKQRCSRARKR